MTEFELKLEIPPERLPGVLAEFAAQLAERVQLRALYFDTALGTLARHGVALRLRSENGAWIQTAKGPSERALERLEHNAPAGASAGDAAPTLDLTLHDGTALGQRICQALATAPGTPLQVLFETDVLRELRMESVGASQVELALDRGRIVAGKRSAPVCELELELKSGDPGAVVQLARGWCARHGLWLSSISKAAKGRQLLQAAAGSVRKAPKPWPASPGAAVDRLLDAASALAVADLPDAVALQQLRDGIAHLAGLQLAPAQIAALRSAIDAAPAPAAAAAVVRSGAFQDALLGLVAAAH